MGTLWLFKKVTGFLSLGLVLLSLFPPQGVAAKTVDERLAELEQEIQLLKRQKEVEKEIQIKKDLETPVLKVSKEGFNVSSKDQAFALKFRGQIQTDARNFFNDERTNQTNTFLLRRVRPTLEGTVFKHFDFRLMPDFGGGSTVLQDAWVNFKYWKAAQVRIGKFKSPIGIERLQADAAGQFIETALSTNLIPNRDIGISLNGELFEGALLYDAGVFNGVTDGGSADTDVHDDKEFAGRIFALPFKNTDIDALNGLGVGVGGSFGASHGSTLPTYRSGGQNSIFSYTPAVGTVTAEGDRLRIAPQAYYYYGPFGFLSEYVLTSQEVSRSSSTVKGKVENNGWQIASTYVLTGENAAYTGVVPRYDFDPGKGQWGAWELAARLSRLRLDPDVFSNFSNPAASVKGATAWDFGVNWYLNRNLKFMTHFEQTLFEGGSIGTQSDRATENALLSRLQVYF